MKPYAEGRAKGRVTAGAGALARRLGRALVPLALVAGMSWAASGGERVYNAVDRGWYDETGRHNPPNDNYLAGRTEGVGYRNFFVFEVPRSSEPIVAAELRVFTYDIASPWPLETYVVWDYTGSIDALKGGTGGAEAFTNLGSGIQYGSLDIPAGQTYQYVAVPLNAAALAQLRSHPGGALAFGGSLPFAEGDPLDHYVFGYSGGFAKAAQLAINPKIKMAVPQPPDVTTNGVDVGALFRPGFTVADDFLCAGTGPITGIHVWASFYRDQGPAAPAFRLGIWSDNPSGPEGFSVPADILWRRDFGPRDYEERRFTSVAGGEWWWDPVLERLEAAADSNVWEYVFSIDPAAALTQQVGKVYWLSVECLVPDPPGGWKTSTNHWNDAAVWTTDAHGGWNRLTYPAPHPWTNRAMDMAFMIQGPDLDSIRGWKYADGDRDKQWTMGERGVSNWWVYLDENGNGVWDDNTVYPSASVPLPIPVRGAVTCLVTVAGVSEPVADVNLLLDIAHTFDSDLRVSLTSPGGVTVPLISSGVGGAGDNFMQTVLDDEAPVSISSGAPPFTGRFRPHSALSAFDGLDPNGTWTVIVDDVASGDSGTVYRCSLGIGTPSAHGEPYALTDSGGAYAFTGLGAGTYTVREDVVTGWTQVTPAPPGEHVVTVGLREPVGTFDFGNDPGPASLGGVKYADLNRSGRRDAGEPGLAGWRIYLDQNANGLFDENPGWWDAMDLPLSIPDLRAVTSTVTVLALAGAVADVNVRVSITHSWDADVRVSLVSPSGTRVALIASGVGASGDNFAGTVFDDEALTNITAGAPPFTGSFRPENPLSAVDGEDPNGIWSLEVKDVAAGDVGTLDGWSLVLATTATREPLAITDADGRYVFTNLAAGVHRVREESRDNWRQTAPAPVPPGEYVVTLGYPLMASLTNDFGNAPEPCRIEGSKFWDLDGNGSREPTEPGLEGWRIYVDVNEDGRWDAGSPSVGDYPASDLPLSIPDSPNPAVTCRVEVAGTAGPVADVNVRLTIAHTFDADLDVYLVSPAGTWVELFTDVGGAGDNFADTVLDDEAVVSITNGAAPFTGSFRPEGRLSSFDGESANGTWQLVVGDDAVADRGTVLACVLTIALGEPSALTDAAGRYSIGGLATGRYVVAEVMQPGWTQTYPPAPRHVVVVQDAEVALNVDFGNAQLDWGDAPTPYPTTAAADGARHPLWAAYPYCLGTAVDSESDGQPHPVALGDDAATTDDEDGVTLLTPLIPGRPSLVGITMTPASNMGFLSAWFDWNGDGDWNDPGETVALGRPIYGGATNLMCVTTPAAARTGRVFARFRLDALGAVPPTGLGYYGEVEDYRVEVRDPASFTRLFSADFDDASGGFDAERFTPSDDQGLQNLWHGSGRRSASGSWSWYYGLESTGDYDTGARNAGNLVSPPIPLAAIAPIVLTFDYFLAAEGSPGRDLPTVEVSDDGGVGWTVLGGKGDPLVNLSGGWNSCALNLSAYAGRTVLIRFRFDTVDENGNAFEGWYVDNVTVFGRELGPKWTQRPDEEYGIDLPSWGIGDPAGARSRYRVADDWKCDGRPIDVIRWWGSYVGSPAPRPPAPRPWAFRLTWYLDQPASGTSYSRPLAELTNAVVMLAPYGETAVPAGYVTEQYFGVVTNKMTPPGFEHEYQYEVRLPAPWIEKEGTIYWISIEALYSAPPSYAWGWMTSIENNIIDDAVVWDNTVPRPTPVWGKLRWPSYPWPRLFETYSALTNASNGGPSLNMAFQLLSDVSPRRAKTWEQPPDMIEGTDMWSWRLQDSLPVPWDQPVRADDFVSDGRPITDIHWWGSYSNWWWMREGSATNPVPPPADLPWRPLGFDLSWHADSGGSPGVELARVFAPIESCHEVFYGSVAQYWIRPGYFEQEYQYYVDLFDPAVSGRPWFGAPGERYWLNIQAVFADGFIPLPEQGQHGGWGWKTTRAWRMVPSMVRHLGSTEWIVEPIPPPHPRMGLPYDLAFELTTDEPAVGAWGSPITCVDIAVGTNRAVVGSVGTWNAGVQILQCTSNLVEGVWSNAMMNPAPFPPPWTNLWRKLPATSSPKMYRVVEQ